MFRYLIVVKVITLKSLNITVASVSLWEFIKSHFAFEGPVTTNSFSACADEKSLTSFLNTTVNWPNHSCPGLFFPAQLSMVGKNCPT